MITKLKSGGFTVTHQHSTIEIEKHDRFVEFKIDRNDQSYHEPHVVQLSPEQLFDMIGQLLTIQAKFKGGRHGTK